ncbi:ABC transporter permease [Alteromonadaceae bacterium M269]|nr:ABC transporter permease [Alteromonadaceae bacterium M269]
MWLVFQKEIKELLRDRRALFFMIALPLLLFPAIFGIIGYFSAKAVSDADSKVLNYGIVGEQYAPDLASRLEATEGFDVFSIPSGADFNQHIKQGDVDFVLVVPDNYNQGSDLREQVKVELHLNDASLNSVFKRVNDIVEELSKSRQDRAFALLNIGETRQEAILKPIVLEKIDTADKRESLGESIGGMVPYVVFLLCLAGGMFPANDIGAGEKERGTLETLLISPIERTQIILGKFMTIGVAGITTALITISSMAIWGIVLSQGMAIESVAEFMGQIGGLDFVLMFLMLIPVAGIFAALLLTLSMYARSVKEAQSYMGSLNFVVIVPVVLAILPGIDLDGGWAWVPLTNVALAIKELIKGTMDYFALIAIFGSTVVIAGALLAFCVYWSKQEKVLFR